MKMSKWYLELILVGSVLSSCITTQKVGIDQMEPGKVSLPVQMRKVALIARNFKFSIDTLSQYYKIDFQFRKGEKRDNQLIDSIAVIKSLDNLRKSLLESGRFEEVFVYPYNAIKSHTGEKELPLTPGFIQSVCTESQTDGVISLEMLSFFYSRHHGTSGREIEGEANVKVTAIWSVYTPKGEGPADRYTHSDVLRWNDYNPENPNQKLKLPLRKEAISIACGEAAKNYSKRIVPHWTESSRILVGINHPDFEKAVSFAMKNKWKAAADTWKKYLESPNTRIAGVAALNFAISQEVLGDPEQAALWSEKSLKCLKYGESGKIARAYAGTLYQRKLKTEKLNTLLKFSHQ